MVKQISRGMKPATVFALSILLFAVFLILSLTLLDIKKTACLVNETDSKIPKGTEKEDVAEKTAKSILAREKIEAENVDAEKKLQNVDANETANPGCKERKLRQYKALDDGKVYYHPSIVHYAKLAKSMKSLEMRLNFREYMSVLSVYKFLKPERLVFHTYTGFSGNYWDKINSWKDVQVEVNVIPLVYKIGGKQAVYVEHQADYVKLTMIHRYGGTALDFDVIMINGTRWKHLQSRSECVLVEETGFVNGGLYSCTQNSSFIAKWLEGYHKDYRPTDWLHNASYKPLDLLINKHSNDCYNVHIDETVCLNPTYIDRKKWLKDNAVEWKNKTAAHYYIKTGIPNDGEGLLKEKFSLADLIKYVHTA